MEVLQKVKSSIISENERLKLEDDLLEEFSKEKELLIAERRKKMEELQIIQQDLALVRHSFRRFTNLKTKNKKCLSLRSVDRNDADKQKNGTGADSKKRRNTNRRVFSIERLDQSDAICAGYVPITFTSRGARDVHE